MLHQLYIIRSQVELAIAAAEANEEVPPQPPVCEHPPEKRRDLTTLGTAPHYKCLACGETVQGTV